jgi:hypothetical protein
MTFEEWEATYKPIYNMIDLNASFEGIMFETYGKELEQVKNFSPNKIWTLVSDGDSILLVSGYAFCNRIGYFLTHKPWDEYMEVTID